MNHSTAGQIDQFKQLIHDSACHADGDAVVGEMNRGCYVRVIVLRRVDTK